MDVIKSLLQTEGGVAYPNYSFIGAFSVSGNHEFSLHRAFAQAAHKQL